jgi:hypothetical protein
MTKTQMVEVQTVAGNIFRGELVSDNASGITMKRLGLEGNVFVPTMRIENVHYF